MDPSTTTRRRWTRILRLQALVLVAGLLALEGVMRAIDASKGDPWSPSAVRQELLGARTRSEGSSASAATDWFKNPSDHPETTLHLHPYFGWEQGPREGLVDAEAQFERAAENAGAYKLFVLGGSVAEAFSLEEQGIAPLREILMADPRFHGKQIHVLPYACGGGKQPQQLERLTYLLALGLVPDAVIEIDGFNELALGRKNATVGVHPVFPSAPHWAYLASAGASDRKGLDLLLELRTTQRELDAACNLALDWHLDLSAVLGQIALGRVRRLQQESGARQEACTRYLTALSENVVRGPSFNDGADESIGECVRCWTQTSLTMQDICRARSIHYLHVLQPTLHDEGSKPLTRGEIASGGLDRAWLEGVSRGYPRLRQAGEWLRAHKVNFLDGSGVFQGNTQEIYFDACHFGKRGNRILAESIGRAFLDSLPAAR